MKTEQYIAAQPIINAMAKVEVVEFAITAASQKTHIKIDPGKSSYRDVDSHQITEAIGGEGEWDEFIEYVHALLLSKLAKRKKALSKELDKI